MARSEARLKVSIWADAQFLALSPMAQRMYMFLLSQPDLAHDGVIPVRMRRWARSATGLTQAELARNLDELAVARFAIIDWDSEELLLRTFIRGDKVYRQPNVLRAAKEHLPAIESEIIRYELAVELARIASEPNLPKDAPEILAEMREVLPDPSSSPPPSTPDNPFWNPSVYPPRVTPRGAEGPAACDSPLAADSTPAQGIVPAGQNPQGNPSAKPSGNPGLGAPADAPASVAATDPAARRGRVTDGALFEIAAGQNPQGNPSAKPSGNPLGDRGDVTTLSGSPGPSPRSSVPPPADREATAQTLLGEYIEGCAKRPPGQVIGQLGKQIKKMLSENVAPDDIRLGLAAWSQRDAHPSVLPSLVNSAMNVRSGGDRRNTGQNRHTDPLTPAERNARNPIAQALRGGAP